MKLTDFSIDFPGLSALVDAGGKSPLTVAALVVLMVTFIGYTLFKGEKSSAVKVLVLVIFIAGLGYVALSLNPTEPTVAAPPAKPTATASPQPQYVLALGEGRKVRRNFIEGVDEGSLQWAVSYNGDVVLRSNAKGETEFSYFRTDAGAYNVELEMFVDGQYRVVSNRVTYQLP